MGLPIELPSNQRSLYEDVRERVFLDFREHPRGNNSAPASRWDRIAVFGSGEQAEQRYVLEAEPRSLYLMDGASRAIWEHSIPDVDSARYSITFRTMKPKP